jgi:GDPmannose 4,6-dehydratase
MKGRVALITGVTGQDGIYLSRLLRGKGYTVVGTHQPGSDTVAAMAPYLDGVIMEPADVRDAGRWAALLGHFLPAEVYNLAAFSSVGASWSAAEQVADINGMAVLRMLEVVLRHRDSTGQSPRIYQASSSEVYGLADHQPQTETTAHHPRSPYAVAKSFAHYLIVNYRESHGLYACNGILFNHESPLRPRHFVTRKITRTAAEISLGRRTGLALGNLDVRRDWGAAEDYVQAMWLMLQQEEPRDFVVATGSARSLHELLHVAFAAAGLGSSEEYVTVDEGLRRPADVPELRGDASRARALLGWSSQLSFEGIMSRMVEADLMRLRRGQEEGLWVLAGTSERST